MKFNIHEQYSETTGIRYHEQSDFSGEDFYHDKLNDLFFDCYNSGDILYLDLDGGDDGFTPSFLDESIGNLIYDFTLRIVSQRLKIISNWEPYWVTEVEGKSYPKWEKRRLTGEKPKITKVHGPWYRLVDGHVEKKVWIEYRKDTKYVDTF